MSEAAPASSGEGHHRARAALTLAARIAHHWIPRTQRKRGLVAFLGPGLITGASDDDPSGIATYSQVGAQFGYSMTWVMLFTWPLMAAIQEISARIGRVTGEGIAGNIREHYPRRLLLVIVALLLVANIINLGADLDAMAAALQLLLGGSTQVYVVGFAVAVPLMAVVMVMQPKVMGPFILPRPLWAMGWLTTGVMAVAVTAMFATWQRS